MSYKECEEKVLEATQNIEAYLEMYNSLSHDQQTLLRHYFGQVCAHAYPDCLFIDSEGYFRFASQNISFSQVWEEVKETDYQIKTGKAQVKLTVKHVAPPIMFPVLDYIFRKKNYSVASQLLLTQSVASLAMLENLQAMNHIPEEQDIEKFVSFFQRNPHDLLLLSLTLPTENLAKTIQYIKQNQPELLTEVQNAEKFKVGLYNILDSHIEKSNHAVVGHYVENSKNIMKVIENNLEKFNDIAKVEMYENLHVQLENKKETRLRSKI